MLAIILLIKQKQLKYVLFKFLGRRVNFKVYKVLPTINRTMPGSSKAHSSAHSSVVFPAVLLIIK